MQEVVVRNLMTLQRDGKSFAGEWTLRGRLITVTLAGYGRKTTQIGDSPPDALATSMLRELVDDQAKGIVPPEKPDDPWLGAKTCRCYKSDYRDPDCERLHPDICPWREFDLLLFVGPLPKKSGH